MLNAVLWKPLPLTEPDRVRVLTWTAPRLKNPSPAVSADEYQQIRDAIRGNADLACGWGQWNAIADWGPVSYGLVSGNYFRVLQVSPLAGRMLLPEDDGVAAAQPVAVISANLWRRAYAGRTGIIGQTIALNRTRLTIVGVMPDGFAGLNAADPRDVIIPRGMAAAVRGTAPQSNSRLPCGEVTARLAAGTTDEALRIRAERVLIDVKAASRSPIAQSVKLRLTRPDAAARTVWQEQAFDSLAVLFGATTVILLATCVNVAGLLLARGRSRRTEIATRLSLGGGRLRVIRQLLTETSVIALVGGGLGIAIAVAAVPLLPDLLGEIAGRNWLNPTLTPGVDLHVDARVIGFAVTVTVLTAIGCGVWPAIRTSGVDLVAAMRPTMPASSGRRRFRPANVAVAVQVGLAMVLLIGAGLLVRSLANLSAVPTGYDARGLLFVRVDPRGRPAPFVQGAVRDLARVPGVRSVTVSQWPLYNNAEPKFPVCVPGAGEVPMDIEPVAPRFFETWGVSLLRGRDFTVTDASSAPSGAQAPAVRLFEDGASAARASPVVIVNATLARRFYGGDALGRDVRVGGCSGAAKTIVGVVADHIDRPRMPVTPMVYVPFPAAALMPSVTFAVRTSSSSLSLVAPVRRVMAEANAQIDGDVITGEAYQEREWRRERVLARALVLFTALALFVCCIGVFGLIDDAVRSRTAELGIRTALGATARDAMRLVMRESWMAVGVGTLAGVSVAIGLARTLHAILFDVVPYDAATMAVSVGMILSTTAIASVVPARAAARIEPMAALRSG
jgi:putative ABC transport system permease protein